MFYIQNTNIMIILIKKNQHQRLKNTTQGNYYYEYLSQDASLALSAAPTGRQGIVNKKQEHFCFTKRE